MKKILFLLVTMVMSLVSCTDQQFLDETLANKALLPTESEFSALIEQARWGRRTGSPEACRLLP